MRKRMSWMKRCCGRNEPVLRRCLAIRGTARSMLVSRSGTTVVRADHILVLQSEALQSLPEGNWEPNKPARSALQGFQPRKQKVRINGGQGSTDAGTKQQLRVDGSSES